MKWCVAVVCLMVGAARASDVATPRQVVSKEVRAAAEAGNRFALKLYEGVKGSGGNVVVGPMCASNALTLVAAGARGETRDEMARVLGWDKGVVESSWGELMGAVSRVGRGVEPKNATGVWVKEGRAVRKDFASAVRGAFAAELGTWREPAAGAKMINQWAERNTGGRISRMVDESTLINTDVFVGGTTYFKGRWSGPFEKGATKEETFRVADGKSVRVKMMHRVERGAAYAETATYQVLWLGYGDGSANMAVVLPKGEIAAVEGEIAKLGLAGLAKPTGDDVVADVSLPRFTMRAQYVLGPVLKEMGMGKAFARDADFSGMVDGQVGARSVVHEAVVDVDEEGTVAAAITGVAVGAMADELPRRVEFKADHPFLFMIVHERTGAVLFMGRVADPTAG